MNKDALVKDLCEMVKPIVEGLGYELYHIEYRKEDRDYYLSIYIDNETPISLEDCEKVSRRVSDLMDEKDPIKDPYFLEVSSPGMNRELHTTKHLTDNIEKNVMIRFNKSIDGKKSLKAKLVGCDDVSITIELENGETQAIQRESIKSINVEAF